MRLLFIIIFLSIQLKSYLKNFDKIIKLLFNIILLLKNKFFLNIDEAILDLFEIKVLFIYIIIL